MEESLLSDFRRSRLAGRRRITRQVIALAIIASLLGIVLARTTDSAARGGEARISLAVAERTDNDLCELDDVICESEIKSRIKVMTTAYVFGPGAERFTDTTPEIAANGENIYKLWRKGDQTCAANFLPFGTKLLIPGFGVCVVRDRMAERFGKRVDIGFGDIGKLRKAREYEIKTIEILILHSNAPTEAAGVLPPSSVVSSAR